MVKKITIICILILFLARGGDYFLLSPDSSESNIPNILYCKTLSSFSFMFSVLSPNSLFTAKRELPLKEIKAVLFKISKESGNRALLAERLLTVIRNPGIVWESFRNSEGATKIVTLPERLVDVDDWIVDNPYLDIRDLGEFAILDMGSSKPYTTDKLGKRIYPLNPKVKIYAVDRFLPYAQINGFDHRSYFDEQGKVLLFEDSTGSTFREEMENYLIQILEAEYKASSNTITLHPYEKVIENSPNVKMIRGGFYLPEEIRPKEPIKLLRCFNTLFHYTPEEAKLALEKMGRMLEEGGLLLEGNNPLAVHDSRDKQVKFVVYKKENQQLKPIEFVFSPYVDRTMNLPALFSGTFEGVVLRKVIADALKKAKGEVLDLKVIVERLKAMGLSAYATPGGLVSLKFHNGQLFPDSYASYISVLSAVKQGDVESFISYLLKLYEQLDLNPAYMGLDIEVLLRSQIEAWQFRPFSQPVFIDSPNLKLLQVIRQAA